MSSNVDEPVVEGEIPCNKGESQSNASGSNDAPRKEESMELDDLQGSGPSKPSGSDNGNAGGVVMADNSGEVAAIPPGLNADNSGEVAEIPPGLNADNSGEVAAIPPGLNADNSGEVAAIPPGLNEDNELARNMLRVIGQFLDTLGLKKSLSVLENECGFPVINPLSIQLKEAVLNGRWVEAVNVLAIIIPRLDESKKDCESEMKFLIYEQLYLESLDKDILSVALEVLRNELSPLNFSNERVFVLSGYLLLTTNEKFRKTAKFSGVGLHSRKKLLNKLETFLTPEIVLPPLRLVTLLHQAVKSQKADCVFHHKCHVNPADHVLMDHVCTEDDIPKHLLQVIHQHDDEVWFCSFSPNGEYLATASKDMKVLIWVVNPDTFTVSLVSMLIGHLYGIGYVSWSKNSKYLLVCGPEECPDLLIWDMTDASNPKKTVLTSPEDSLTICCWRTEETFIVGGSRGQFYLCDVGGNILKTWEGVRVMGLACRNNGDILAADTHNRIRSYHFDDSTNDKLFKEIGTVISFVTNKEDTMALTNVLDKGVRLWDFEYNTLIRSFKGGVQGNTAIYSCFGGLDEKFVASGSEDNKVYLWSIDNDEPLCILEGHENTVNGVSWNPVHHQMLASASDDCTVRIWGPKSKVPEGGVNDSYVIPEIAENIFAFAATFEPPEEEEDGPYISSASSSSDESVD